MNLKNHLEHARQAAAISIHKKLEIRAKWDELVANLVPLGDSAQSIAASKTLLPLPDASTDTDTAADITIISTAGISTLQR